MTPEEQPQSCRKGHVGGPNVHRDCVECWSTAYDALRAENERQGPVVEAAVAWHGDGPHELHVKQLHGAVLDYLEGMP